MTIKVAQKNELLALAKLLDDEVRTTVSDILERLQDVKDELQERYDEKSERWQQGEAGVALEEKVTSLQAALDSLSNIDSTIDEAYGNLTEVGGEDE